MPVCTDALMRFYRTYCDTACCAELMGPASVVFHSLQAFEGSPAAALPGTAITLQTVPVDHCYDAHALVLAGSNWRIAFSGDCRPSSALAAHRPAPDVLVHEATFAVGLESDALAKRHSTVAEAIGVAAQMHARFLLLTHFSQRYSHLFPAMPPQSTPPQVPLMCAFDHMVVTHRTLPRLPAFVPVLQELFQDDTTSITDKD